MMTIPSRPPDSKEFIRHHTLIAAESEARSRASSLSGCKVIFSYQSVFSLMMLIFALTHCVAVASPVAEIFGSVLTSKELQEHDRSTLQQWTAMKKSPGFEDSPHPIDSVTTSTRHARFILDWATAQVLVELRSRSPISDHEFLEARTVFEKHGALVPASEEMFEYGRLFRESLKRATKVEDQSDEALLKVFAEMEDRFPTLPGRPRLTSEQWLPSARLHVRGVKVAAPPATDEELDRIVKSVVEPHIYRKRIGLEQIALRRLMTSEKLQRETEEILNTNPRFNLSPSSAEDVSEALEALLFMREWALFETRTLRDHLIVHDPDTMAEVEMLIRVREQRAEVLDNYSFVLDMPWLR